MTVNTIGELIDLLTPLDQAAAVFIDNRPPTALSSYRGFYDHLAIERDGKGHEKTELDQPSDPFDIDLPGWGTYTPGSSEVRIKDAPTVGDLVEALNLADGATFEGYKGGQYQMGRGSDLWVSDWSMCDSLRIGGIENLTGRVDLVTVEVDW